MSNPGTTASTPATPAVAPASDTVSITVDGVPMKAKKGEMLIRVTDANDVYVPRFCYHEKLPVAANCRMCLVDVEKAPKPMPACATPVMDGMVVHTRSTKAIAAQ
jgi:NADH-quinone oxidoreductase subunit G